MPTHPKARSAGKGALLAVAMLAALAAFGAATAAGPAAAALLDIRLDLGSGYATIPTRWNEVGTPFLSTVTVAGAELPLYDFNAPASPTDVALKVTRRFFTSTFSSQSTWANPHAPWMDANGLAALADWALAHGDQSQGELVFTGLNPGSRYVIELIGLRVGIDTNASYLVNGAAGTAVFAGTPGTGTTATWNADDDGYGAQGFMQWLNMAPNASGEIAVTIDRKAGTYAFLNAMRLAEIPEPGAATMLLIALPALFPSKRTRRT